MTEQPTAAPGGGNVRPTFLTVLCILSWVFQGLGAIGLILLLVGGSMAAGAGAGAVGGNIMLIAGGGLVITLISFYAVLQMWKLKKMGFYIYTGLFVVGLLLPVIAGAGFTFDWTNIVSIAFVVMYGLNLKHMN